MFTVIVHLEVRPDRIGEFIAGIAANSRASRADEPGCLRFDVHRMDAHRFLLHEVYRDEDAFRIAHRGTPHYQAWQRVVVSCVVPGTQQNTYGTPAFPEDIT